MPPRTPIGLTRQKISHGLAAFGPLAERWRGSRCLVPDGLILRELDSAKLACGGLRGGDVRLALLLEVEVRVGEEAEARVEALLHKVAARLGASLRKRHPAHLLFWRCFALQ